MNPKLKSFFDQAKQIKIAKPAPKFQIGDFIICSKYKVISKIIDIKGIFDNEDRTVNYDHAMYVMEDLKNLARDKFMTTGDMRLYPQPVHANKVYKRTRPVHGIDFGYNKMNPEAAQALYSKSVTNGDDNEPNHDDN